MRNNHLKTMLREGKPTYGGWLSIPNVFTARAFTRLGFDWLLIDTEHTAQHPDMVAQMIATIADARTSAPLVRVPSKRSEEWFKWTLDAGAWGVMVPYINTRAEALQAVEWCKYPPEGKRSHGGYFAPHGFGSADRLTYLQSANDEVLVSVQIETTEALENLEEILSVPGIDVAFVGPNDLHYSLGLPPSNEGAEPEFVEALNHIHAVARQHKVATGIYTSGGAAAAERVREGFQMVVAAADLSAMTGGATQTLKAARGE